MKYKILLIILLLLIIPLTATVAIALGAGAVQSGKQNQANLLPNQPFTYQGELLDDGQPEPGPCDFQFGLWDAPDLGSQVGITQTLTNIPLDSGRFSVVLNDDGQIGASPFDGQALWMAIEVDCPSGAGSFVSLTPRQQLTATPYAHFSTEAGSVPWAGITSKPDGFADDIDNDTLYDAGTGLDLITTTFNVDDGYQLPQGCTAGHLVEWDGSGWGCQEPTEPGYANVIVVAKSGGDFETIRGAIDSISDASMETRYLVWVAPGVYSETVDMMSWVDIEGAGEGLTRIKSHGFPSSAFATVFAAANSELRYLTVENIGGNERATAITFPFDDFTLRNVRVIAHGGTFNNIGVSVWGGTANNMIRNCSINVDSQLATSASYGIFAQAIGDISLSVEDLIIEANSSVNQDLNGIAQLAGTDYTNVITATKLMVRTTNTGSNDAWAFRSSGVGTRFNINNSSLYGYGSFGIGLYVANGGTFLTRNVEIEGNYYGVRINSSANPATVRIDGASIVGGIYSALVAGGAGNELNFGTSLLDGDSFVAPGDTLICVNSYDENYTNVNGFDACP
ncbi:MAG TPA: hypothetical protein VFI27_10745 [candidate division Zixibacteria bacterium]|nr:hypothetical protein [candidate division Zixibacteria bacterium]